MRPSALAIRSRTCRRDDHQRDQHPMNTIRLLIATALALTAAQNLHAQGT